MSLEKLARFCFNRPWPVLLAWVVLLVVVGLGAFIFQKPPSSAISIPGTPAQVAIDQLAKTFPNAGKGTGRIVFYANKSTIPDFQTNITVGLGKIAGIKGVSTIVSPFQYNSEISKDKHTAYAQVQLTQQNGQISASTLDAIHKAILSMIQPGLEVEYGGDLINNVPSKILGPTEILGVFLALVVLLLAFRSPVAAGIPLVIALIAVGGGIGGLFALSRVVSVNSTTPALSVMLGLAVGIDYSLFIISKYRNNLLEKQSPEDAVAAALKTAGKAVAYAAGTVFIALAALSLVRIPFMTIMGFSAAATVLIAALAALTVTPALFKLAGNRVLSKSQQTSLSANAAPAAPAASGFPDKWTNLLTTKPWPVIIAGIAILVVLALPVLKLELGFPSDQFAAKDTSQRKAYDLMVKAFGPGFNTPLTILAQQVPPVTATDIAQIRAGLMAVYQQQVAAATARQEADFAQAQAQVKTRAQAQALEAQIATAQAAGASQQQTALAQINQALTQNAPLYQLNLVAQEIAAQTNVQEAVPALVTPDGATGLIQVIPKSSPASAQTKDLIAYLSNHQSSFLTNHHVKLQVTGATALQIDTNTKLAAALPQYLLVVVGLSLVLLTLAFRSIIIPIKATAGFILSVLGMFGAIVAVFQLGWLGLTNAPAPIISFVPIIGIGVLFGLAMDYEFFVVSSIREAYLLHPDAKTAVTNGYKLGSKVVAAAGSIMVAVFAGFIGNENVVIQTLGFGLAMGILLDAFIVRMSLVPAAMSMLGKAVWWFPLRAAAPAPQPTPLPAPAQAAAPSPAPQTPETGPVASPETVATEAPAAVAAETSAPQSASSVPPVPPAPAEPPTAKPVVSPKDWTPPKPKVFLPGKQGEAPPAAPDTPASAPEITPVPNTAPVTATEPTAAAPTSEPIIQPPAPAPEPTPAPKPVPAPEPEPAAGTASAAAPEPAVPLSMPSAPLRNQKAILELHEAAGELKDIAEQIESDIDNHKPQAQPPVPPKVS